MIRPTGRLFLIQQQGAGTYWVPPGALREPDDLFELTATSGDSTVSRFAQRVLGTPANVTMDEPRAFVVQTATRVDTPFVHAAFGFTTSDGVLPRQDHTLGISGNADGISYSWRSILSPSWLGAPGAKTYEHPDLSNLSTFPMFALPAGELFTQVSRFERTGDPVVDGYQAEGVTVMGTAAVVE